MTGQLPLAFTAPDPRRLCRRSDSGGSAAAAIDVVESGADAVQVAVAIAFVVSLPGRTSRELAEETARIASARWGYKPETWRYVLGRRLSEAEDEGRGPIIGSEVRYHPDKNWRRVIPEQAPCFHADRAAIRWWPADRSTTNAKGA